MHINEGRKHSLRKIYKTKKGVRIKESDHHTIISEFNCKVSTNNKRQKIEVYNLKNKECQANFKSFITSTKMFSSIFDSSDNVDDITDRLVKKINGAIAMIFSKRRISFKANDTKMMLFLIKLDILRTRQMKKVKLYSQMLLMLLQIRLLVTLTSLKKSSQKLKLKEVLMQSSFGS